MAAPSSVFVRNLAFDTTDQALEQHFGSVGPVREAWVVRDRKTKESRGFGFVGFVLADDAQRAVQEQNGSLLGGRKITVDLAKKKGATSAPPSGAPEQGAAAPAPRKRGAGGPSGEAKRAKPAREPRQRHRVIIRNLAFSCDAAALRAAVGPHAQAPAPPRQPRRASPAAPAPPMQPRLALADLGSPARPPSG